MGMIIRVAGRCVGEGDPQRDGGSTPGTQPITYSTSYPTSPTQWNYRDPIDPAPPHRYRITLARGVC